jgi:hypothetical protein
VLTSIRRVEDVYDITYRFEYGAGNKPAAMHMIYNGVLQPDSTLYFYNDKGQLIRSVLYEHTPAEIREIRKYYYNDAGLLIADTLFDENGYYSYLYNNNYTYDNKRRLTKHLSSSSWYRRYEYGDGNNPVKTYMKPYDRDTEALEYEFKEFDDKVGYHRYDTLMRIFQIQHYAGSYNEELPICSYHNNALQFFRHPYPHPGGETWIRDNRQEIGYNSEGYPTKATVFLLKESGNGAYTVRTVYFEYKKLE